MLFDISKIESVRANPLLARALVKSVPPYELAKMALTGGYEHNLLDEAPIIDGILASGDDALELVLAAYGSSGGYGGMDADALERLALKSDGHKAAVFGNPRINWYRLKIFEEAAVERLARETLLEGGMERPSEFVRVLATNPRYNRETLGHIIRGAVPYQSVPLPRRTFIAYHAIAVEEIPSDNYPGKDAPDDNELHFSDPVEGLPTLVRDVFAAGGRSEFDKFSASFIWRLRGCRLEIEVDDWISKEEADALNEGASDFVQRRSRKYAKAYENVRRFVSTVFAEAMSPGPRADGSRETADDKPALFAVLLIAGLERSYWLSDAQQQVARLRQMLSDRCWVIRAAAYAVLFDSIRLGDDDQGVREFERAFPNDSFEKWFGVISTDTYAEAISEHFDGTVHLGSAHAETLRQLYGALHAYIFNVPENADELAAWRRKRKRYSAALVAEIAAGHTGAVASVPKNSKQPPQAETSTVKTTTSKASMFSKLFGGH